MAGNLYTGVSRKSYPYMLINISKENLVPTHGGNYVFAKPDAGRTPIFIEAADNLRESIFQTNKTLCEHALSVHGATLVFVHIDKALGTNDRHREKMDLIDGYNPPMNVRG